jgi:hypothetical protein
MASKAIAYALWSIIASGAKNSDPSIEASSSHRSYLETCRCGDFLKRRIPCAIELRWRGSMLFGSLLTSSAGGRR